MKKRITIEDLAIMVQHGFTEVARQIGEIKIDIIGIKNELVLLNNKSDKTLGLYYNHETRISNLEDNVIVIKNKLK